MTLGQDETTPYSPEHHHWSVAEDIANGTACSIAASNLLVGIANSEVTIAQLPVSLRTIEEVAGRKLYEPIVD